MRLAGSAVDHGAAPRPRPGDRAAPPRRRARRQPHRHGRRSTLLPAERGRHFTSLRSANELISGARALPRRPGHRHQGRPDRRRHGDGRTSCAARSSRTCANSAATTSTWSTCAAGPRLDRGALRRAGRAADAGLIRHLGISNARAEHLAEARAIAPVVASRTPTASTRPGNDEMLRVCGEQGIAFVPFFAIAAAGREAGGVAGNATVQAVAHDARSLPRAGPDGLDVEPGPARAGHPRHRRPRPPRRERRGRRAGCPAKSWPCSAEPASASAMMAR